MRKNFDEIKKLGDMLRSKREELGLTVKFVSNSTRIRENYIIDLENSNYDNLPNPVYTKGFIVKYAKLLGINPDTALAFYRREHHDSVKPNKLKSNKKREINFNIESIFSQRGVLIITILFIFILFGVYLVSRINNVVSPPEFSISAPANISGGESQTIEIKEDSFDIKGKLALGSSLKLNEIEVDTKNLDFFEISNLELEEGENKFILTATSSFGVSSTIEITILKNPNESVTSDKPEDTQETLDEMFIEMIIGPNDANVKITIDGALRQNQVESVDTVKTFKAKNSFIIETPRPDSVRIAINGEDKVIDVSTPIEFKIIEGQVIRSK